MPAEIPVANIRGSVDDMATYLHDLTDRIREMETEAAEIRRWLALRLDIGSHKLGGLSVTVYRPRRFDPHKAAKVLPSELVKKCSVPVVDRARAERILTAEMYAECQIEGKRTVRIA